MGSRIMHLIIANKIAARLMIEDRTPFLLGSIAPDAVATKNESHFFIGEHQDYSRSVDYKGFLNKYSSQAESHYILGYFTHLIAMVHTIMISDYYTENYWNTMVWVMN